MVRGCSVQVGIVISLELSVAHVHRGGKVSLVNFGSNVFGELYSFHERSAHNLVLADSDDWNGRLGRHLQDGTDSLNTLQSGQPTIIGASGTTALGMTENGGTSVQAQTLCEDGLTAASNSSKRSTVSAGLAIQAVVEARRA